MEPAGRALLLKICVKAKIFDQISHGILVLYSQGTGSILPHRVILKEGPKVLQVGPAGSAHGENGVKLQGAKCLYSPSG
jgi:hypothetical protein